MPVKRLGFFRRALAADAAGFAAAWREEALSTIERAGGAGPLARVHCVGRDQRDRALHHGISIEWFAGEFELAEFDASSAERASGGAHAATIESAPSILVSERLVSGNDDLIAQWRRPGGSDVRQPVLIGFIERAPHLSRTEFADYWWAQHRPLANALVPAEVGPAAYVHNYVLDGQPGSWDGIGELYEESLEKARLRGAWFASPAAADLIADEERFLIRATRQVLVCDQEIISSVR